MHLAYAAERWIWTPDFFFARSRQRPPRVTYTTQRGHDRESRHEAPMEFHLCPRCPKRNRARFRSLQDSATEIDPDQWVELASGFADSRHPSDPEVDVEVVRDLKEQLCRVLADASGAMMVPPSAGSMNERVWAAMPGHQRATFTCKQLRRLDPRLLSRMIIRRAARLSIHSGH